MLQIQQIMDAATAADESQEIQFIPGPGLNLGAFALKAEALPLSSQGIDTYTC